MKPEVLILSDHPESSNIIRLTNSFSANNYEVHVCDVEFLISTDIKGDLLIVDLDTIDHLKDNDDFCELLADRSPRILIMCSSSMKRLLYYKTFECFSNIDNLLDREFFSHE